MFTGVFDYVQYFCWHADANGILGSERREQTTLALIRILRDIIDGKHIEGQNSLWLANPLC